VCRQSELWVRLETANYYEDLNSLSDIYWDLYGDANGNANVTEVSGQGTLSYKVLTTAAPGAAIHIVASYRTPCLYTSKHYYAVTQSTATAQPLANGRVCMPIGSGRPASPAVPYPNPASTTLEVPGLTGTVKLLNSLGRLVQLHHLPAGPSHLTLDVHTLPDGLYLLTGQDAAGQPVRQRVQVQH
jgi:hypothetical protein